MGFLNVKTNYSVYKNCMLRLGRYMLDESLLLRFTTDRMEKLQD